MSYAFVYNQRLGISIPYLEKDWEEYADDVQNQILLEWEAQRADIPAKIKEIELIIGQKQEELNNEDNFNKSCLLNNEIAELASLINDLNIWFRIEQDTTRKVHL